MKDRITNQLDMAGACINVATKPEYQAVWNVTPAGRAFIAAWKQARIIVDAGHGPIPEDPPAPGPSNPPTP